MYSDQIVKRYQYETLEDCAVAILVLAMEACEERIDTVQINGFSEAEKDELVKILADTHADTCWEHDCIIFPE